MKLLRSCCRRTFPPDRIWISGGWALRAGILTALLLWLPARGAAQESSPTATLRGRVRDPMGTPLAAVSVTAKAVETGQSRTVRANAQGEFELT